MAKPNKNSADTTTLQGRLAFCVATAGGKKQLALTTGISEAQIFRYMNTLSDMPVSKLVAISEAAGVSPGWLLNGDTGAAVVDTAPKTPPFRPALMQYVARMLDEFLVEYQKPIPPRLKSGLLTLIYEALRHEEVLSGQENLPNKFQFLGILNFLTALRSEEEIEVYRAGLDLLEHPEKHTDSKQHTMQSFNALIQRSQYHYYNSFSGQAYYERIGQNLSPTVHPYVHKLMAHCLDIFKTTDVSVLDLGCGNGGVLSFIHQHYPKAHLAGIDVSSFAIELCKKLEASGRLPTDTARAGSADVLPYANSSINAIYTAYTLHYLPYFQGAGIGLEAAWAEMYRVLKPGGVCFMAIPIGIGHSFGIFRQFITQKSFEALAKQNGFNIKEISAINVAPTEEQKTIAACTPTIGSTALVAILQKNLHQPPN